MSYTNRPNQKLNIEQMVTHLKLQWQAPSPKTAQGFTPLSNRLAGLIKELQSNPSLNFLDQQFYPEWRVFNRKDTVSTIDHQRIFSLPETSTDEFRQGFYFCSRLIQLMEDVYIDLDLETYRDHPDNRGWINLFRHWSWSAMFQACWTISACTYGIRFQRFCHHTLNLVLGKVTTSLIVFEQVDHSTLNAFEILQVKAVHHIYQKQQDNLQLHLLNLHVASPLPSEDKQAEPLIPVFNFGYAITIDQTDSQKKSILMFRIQDHLRNLGLGNAGLSKLVLEQSKSNKPTLVMEPGYRTYFKQTAENEDENLGKMLCDPLFNREITKHSIAQFVRIFDSTQAKLQAQVNFNVVI